MNEELPIDGEAVVNHLLNRIASLERELAMAVGNIAAVLKAAPRAAPDDHDSNS